MHGWVCEPCNALWDLKDAFARYVGQHPYNAAVDPYCPTCNCFHFHAGSCADQNALLDYPYGKHPIPYPKKEKQ